MCIVPWTQIQQSPRLNKVQSAKNHPRNTLLGNATNTLLGNATNITPLKRRTSRGPGLWMVGGVSFPGIRIMHKVLSKFEKRSYRRTCSRVCHTCAPPPGPGTQHKYDQRCFWDPSNFKSSTFLQRHIYYLNVDFHITICAAVKVLAIFSDPEFWFTVKTTLHFYLMFH